MKYPKGFRMRGQTQVAIRFPDKLFAEIIMQAKREGKDFNTMVLDLVRCGKLDLEESDQHEPCDHRWTLDEVHIEICSRCGIERGEIKHDS